MKDKIYRIVTDNAAAMIKAYQFGLIVTDDDDLNDDNAINRMQQNNSTFDETFDDDSVGYISNEWHLLDWNSNQLDSIDNDDNSSIRLSCFAHSLQLTVRDGLKNAPHLSSALSKCMKISNRTHKSTKLLELMEEVGKTLRRSNSTRWSSEFLLIKSIVEKKKKQSMK